MNNRLLFVDTETTGKALFKAPYKDKQQPHIVQIALLHYEGEEERFALNTLVQPEGFTVPKEALAIHGISTERAEAYGLPLATVLSIYADLMSRSDLLVGHNISFDAFVLDCEMARLNFNCPRPPTYCTMKSAAGFTRIPGPRGDWKWPRLEEACQLLLGQPLAGAHDAMNDLRATQRLYRWLCKAPSAASPTPPLVAKANVPVSPEAPAVPPQVSNQVLPQAP